MIPAAFDYESPRTLSEALSLLASRPDARLLAGGHSLLPILKLRLGEAGTLIDLGRVGGLNYIRESAGRIAIGAMTTHAAIAGSPLLRSACPLLPAAASTIGDVQVRNCGTIGGSLAHADPAADYPAAILALDAEMVATSQKGDRVLTAAKFFVDLYSTALQPGEILTEIRVPRTDGAGASYQKFRHPASGFAVAGVAALARMRGSTVESAAVGVTGIAPKPYRAKGVEKAIAGRTLSAVGEAAAHAADGVEALSDDFASADYRRHLAQVLARRALEQAAASRKRG